MRRNAGVFSLIIVLLLIAFISFELKGDYSAYIATTANSTPFYMFAIRRLIIPVIVAVILLIRYIKERKTQK